MTCPVVLAYAANDTDEFQRQTKTFAAGLAEKGRPPELVALS